MVKRILGLLGWLGVVLVFAAVAILGNRSAGCGMQRS